MMNTQESARTFGERLREHFRSLFHIFDHTNTTGYHSRLDNFSNVGSKSYSFARTIKKAMCIRVYDPSLNRNSGKHQLSHIWEKVF